MPVVQTTHFGTISYQPDSILDFPGGLPGFEDRKQFLPIHMAENDPLIFLQSLEQPALCFITMPVTSIDPGYRRAMAEDDAALLGFPAGHAPQVGADVLCLAVVSLKESGPTANLLAPLVIRLESHRGVQAIAPGSAYSWEHPLLAPEVFAPEAVACL